jgi:hypothetical protein
MCFACDMEAMWFAVMEARANAAGAGDRAPQGGEQAALLASAQQEEPATLLIPVPPDEPDALLPPLEEGGAGASDARERPNSARQSPAPPRRFACEETSAE